jgi:hypothetical protein
MVLEVTEKNSELGICRHLDQTIVPKKITKIGSLNVKWVLNAGLCTDVP